MQIELKELNRLISATVALRAQSYDRSIGNVGRYTLPWYEAAETTCGSDHPWLELVHFLAMSGEGAEIVDNMAKAQE